MADTNNRRFSVMVDDSGVLSYPQNFITANQLAKFGSDVVGTFKEIKLGSEEIGPSTITVLNPSEVESLGYNTDLIISNKNYGGYINRIILNFSENNNDLTVGPGLKMEYNTVLGTADIRLSTTASTHSSGTIYLNSFNTSITCDSQFTVTSNYGVSLNSSEGGFYMNMPEGNTLIKTGGLTSILSQKESGAVEIGVGHSYFDIDMPAPGTLSNNIIIDKDKIAVSAPLVELPANTTIGGKTIATGAPSNMVTTDTEQTITGNKTFTGEIGIGSIIGKRNTGISISTFRDNGTENETFVSRPGMTILRAGHDVAEIPAELSIVYDYKDNSSQITLSSRNVTIGTSEETYENTYLTINTGGTNTYEYYRTNKFVDSYNFAHSDTGFVLSLSSNKVDFAVPLWLRVYDTVTEKWTNTHKYAYLAQDANGNITLAISDKHPSASVEN